MKRVIYGAATALLMLSQPLFATDSKPTTNEFVRDAKEAGTAEVILGKLALEKSKNETVRKFASTMIEDHQKGVDTLNEVASKQSIVVPPAAADSGPVTTLSKQEGSAFDRAYVEQMVKDHKKAVSLFENASLESGMNPAVRDYATTTLPTLRDHLQHATELEKSLDQKNKY